MKSLPTTTSLTVALTLLSFLAATGCNSMNKQPADPYAGTRIPPPATFSYSPTILGQQPGQPVYTPPGAASTYPPTTPSTTPSPATVPTTPSSSPGPVSSEQPASVYGSLPPAAIQPMSATNSAAPAAASWTATQPVPSAYSSATATQAMDALAASTPIAPSVITPASLDTWSTSSGQIVTQVVE